MWLQTTGISTPWPPAKTQPGKAEEPSTSELPALPSTQQGQMESQQPVEPGPPPSSHSWGQILAEPECTWVQSQHKGGQGGTWLCTFLPLWGESRTYTVLHTQTHIFLCLVLLHEAWSIGKGISSVSAEENRILCQWFPWHISENLLWHMC